VLQVAALLPGIEQGNERFVSMSVKHFQGRYAVEEELAGNEE